MGFVGVFFFGMKLLVEISKSVEIIFGSRTYLASP